MNLQQLLDAIDERVSHGDFLGAVDAFFADQCITSSAGPDATHGKQEKLQSLRWFFDSMARTNRIERLNALVDGDISYSEFIFDFSDRHGQQHTWHEVIRRRWENGKVIEERYFTDLSNENPMAHLVSAAAAEKKPAKKTATPKKAAETADTKPKPAAKKANDAPATAEKKPAAKKAADPVTEEKPAPKKTTPKKSAKAEVPAEKPATRTTAPKKSAASDNTKASDESAPAKKTTTRKKA